MKSTYYLNLNNHNDYQNTYQTNTNQTPRRVYQESFPNQQTHFRTESILNTHNSLTNNNTKRDDTLLSHNFYNQSHREPITFLQRNNSSIQRSHSSFTQDYNHIVNDNYVKKYAMDYRLAELRENKRNLMMKNSELQRQIDLIHEVAGIERKVVPTCKKDGKKAKKYLKVFPNTSNNNKDVDSINNKVKEEINSIKSIVNECNDNKIRKKLFDKINVLEKVIESSFQLLKDKNKGNIDKKDKLIEKLQKENIDLHKKITKVKSTLK